MDKNKNDITNKDNKPFEPFTGFLHLPLNVSADYEKAEMDQLRASLKRSYTERFLVMTRLMKRGIMIKNAKIIHNSFAPSQS